MTRDEAGRRARRVDALLAKQDELDGYYWLSAREVAPGDWQVVVGFEPHEATS